MLSSSFFRLDCKSKLCYNDINTKMPVYGIRQRENCLIEMRKAMDFQNYTYEQLFQFIIDTFDYDKMNDAAEELMKRSSDDQLVQFIEEMAYYEIIPQALNELMKRSSAKAFDMGMHILIYDKGDQFLQACVWSSCFSFDDIQTVTRMCQRKIIMEWSLMETLLLSIQYRYEADSFPPAFQKLIIDSYHNMPEEKQAAFSDMFSDFLARF